MNNLFFFQTQPIPDSSSSFDQFKQQNIFFSYFQVDQNYYLFLYAQQSIDINLLYQSVEVIQELDSKQRKIRSLRGFFLYALEIMENGENYEILKTNLQPFFWRKVKNIIQQNKKAALQEFLFGKAEDYKSHSIGSIPALEEKIESLENQVNSLQERVIHLEKQNLEMKESINVLSEDSKSPLKKAQQMKEYNIASDQSKAQNHSNFITPGKISEEEQIEIIQREFQLRDEDKIPLKKYYESTDSNSLFQLKGYKIKYEVIRKNNLYKKLNPSN
jgi:hypothetical protein